MWRYIVHTCISLATGDGNVNSLSIPAELKKLEAEAMGSRHDRFTTLSYTLPQDGRRNNSNNPMGTQSPNYTDERADTLVASW